MTKRISVAGYKAFQNVIENYSRKDLIYCYLSGDKDETGKSWCQRCVVAEPFILAALEKYAKKHAVFIYTEIGNREEFLNEKNPFRTDKNIRMTVIPDLMRWKHAWRLQGGYCAREDLLQRFFEKYTD